MINNNNNDTTIEMCKQHSIGMLSMCHVIWFIKTINQIAMFCVDEAFDALTT